ncbi:cell wall integrity and stress response component 1-like [Osmia bicornis bicornis]|uniref:cell wall integrity and stress response component 1-like n=1 Tax=Osmia bicornis bicornis TaxID=1437191 RepID=UPI001EAEF801|nr:cell wall integrity and stress response component 1-like [Osmia bicornis bicornis]
MARKYRPTTCLFRTTKHGKRKISVFRFNRPYSLIDSLSFVNGRIFVIKNSVIERSSSIRASCIRAKASTAPNEADKDRYLRENSEGVVGASSSPSSSSSSSPSSPSSPPSSSPSSVSSSSSSSVSSSSSSSSSLPPSLSLLSLLFPSSSKSLPHDRCRFGANDFWNLHNGSTFMTKPASVRSGQSGGVVVVVGNEWPVIKTE